MLSRRKKLFLRFFPFALLCFLLPPAPRLRADDLKLVIWTQMSSPAVPAARPFVFTVYVKGPRAREELRLFAGVASEPGGRGPLTYYYGHRAARVYQCDRQRVYDLDLDAHEYTVGEMDARGFPANWRPPQPLQPSGAMVTVTIESRDTRERKRIFGLLARHIVTDEKIAAGPGACAQSRQIERDGWYADLPAGASCFPLLGPYGREAPVPSGECNGKRDQIEVHRSGIAEAGFPLELTIITKSQRTQPKGTAKPSTSTVSRDVVELSPSQLDPRLFEVPAGFQRVQKLNLGPAVPLSARLQLEWQRLRNFLRSVLE